MRIPQNQSKIQVSIIRTKIKFFVSEIQKLLPGREGFVGGE
jgi:hypothetical protein